MIPAEYVVIPSVRSDNVSHALKAIEVLFQPGDVIEIRALDVGRNDRLACSTHAGYFQFGNVTALAKAIRTLDGDAEGVYFVLNKLNPVLLARSSNRLKPRLKNTTTDVDIVERRWLVHRCRSSASRRDIGNGC